MPTFFICNSFEMYTMTFTRRMNIQERNEYTVGADSPVTLMPMLNDIDSHALIGRCKIAPNCHQHTLHATNTMFV